MTYVKGEELVAGMFFMKKYDTSNRYVIVDFRADDEDESKGVVSFAPESHVVILKDKKTKDFYAKAVSAGSIKEITVEEFGKSIFKERVKTNLKTEEHRAAARHRVWKFQNSITEQWDEAVLMNELYDFASTKDIDKMLNSIQARVAKAVEEAEESFGDYSYDDYCDHAVLSNN